MSVLTAMELRKQRLTAMALAKSDREPDVGLQMIQKFVPKNVKSIDTSSASAGGLMRGGSKPASSKLISRLSDIANFQLESAAERDPEGTEEREVKQEVGPTFRHILLRDISFDCALRMGVDIEANFDLKAISDASSSISSLRQTPGSSNMNSCIVEWAHKQRAWVYPSNCLPRLSELKIDLDSADVQHLLSNASYWAYSNDSNPTAVSVLRNRRIEWQDALDSAIDLLTSGSISKLYILNVVNTTTALKRSPSMIIFSDQDADEGSINGRLVNVSSKFLGTLVKAGAKITVLMGSNPKSELSTLGAAARTGEGKIVILHNKLAVKLALSLITEIVFQPITSFKSCADVPKLVADGHFKYSIERVLRANLMNLEKSKPFSKFEATDVRREDTTFDTDKKEESLQIQRLHLSGELIPSSISVLISALREAADVSLVKSKTKQNDSDDSVLRECLSLDEILNGSDSFSCLNVRFAKKRQRETQPSNVIVISNTVPSLNKKQVVATSSKNPFRISSSTTVGVSDSFVEKFSDTIPSGAPYFKMILNTSPNVEKMGYEENEYEEESVYQLNSIVEIMWVSKTLRPRLNSSKIDTDTFDIMSLQYQSLEGIPGEKFSSSFIVDSGEDEVLDPVKIYERFAE